MASSKEAIMRALSVAILGASLLLGSTAHSQTSVKVGALTDLSGPDADLSGQGLIIGTQLAVEEFKEQNEDIAVEVISADHLNKPDIGGAIAAVVAEMKKLPTKDVVFGEGSVREDGRQLRDMYLFEVKKPEESKGACYYYRLLAEIPVEDAFPPLSESACPFVKKARGRL
jgi:hypothetical protein